MADKVLNTKIQLRNDTVANWTTNNPVLLKGEVGIVVDSSSTENGYYKVGDGTSAWNSLSFATPTSASISSTVTTSITAVKGVASGLASLDSTGKVPAAQLPVNILSGVVTATSLAGLPETGDEGKIYLVTADNVTKQYRWDGSAYVEIPTGSGEMATSLSAGTQSVNVNCLVNDEDDLFVINCGDATV